MKLGLILFLLSLSAHVTGQTCREQAQQKLMKNLSQADYDKKKKASPSTGYLEELHTSSCEIAMVKQILLSKEFNSLCKNLQTPYRLRCLREWISQYKVTNSAEITSLIALAPLAGVEDKKLPYVSNQAIITLLVDTVLLVFERVDIRNLYVQRLASNHPDLQKEIEKLTQRERDALSMSQRKMESALADKVSLIKDQSGREPAADQSMRQWIQSTVPRLELRLQNLKAKNWQ